MCNRQYRDRSIQTLRARITELHPPLLLLPYRPGIYSLTPIPAGHSWHGVLTAHVRPIACFMAAYH